MRLLLAGLFSIALAAAPPSPQDCSGCHEVDLVTFETSAHASMGCTGCHSSITKLPHVGKPAPVACSTCHGDEVKAYSASVHGVALHNGQADAATCRSCHGPEHRILTSDNPASRTNKKNLADTCASCHSDPKFLAKHQIPFAKPVEAYRLSVHGREVAKGNNKAASCSDCHGNHDILSASDTRAKVNRANVAATCGACHSDIKAI